MKRFRYCILFAALFLTLAPARAEAPSSPLSPPESYNKVITISDSGIEPTTLTMRKEDRIAFFLNNSSESLITLAVSFGKNATHCASENLQIGEDGAVHSTRPIPPKDFATTCFHDPGTYSYTVFGLKSAPKGIQGSILVR